MKKIYPIENIIIVNQNFVEAENNVGIDVAVVRECHVIKSSEIEIRLNFNWLHHFLLINKSDNSDILSLFF